MGRRPVPAGWTEDPRSPDRGVYVLREASDAEAPRLVSRVEFAASASLRSWRDEVVDGLARSMEDWLLIDVGPARIAGTRGFRVLGASAPAGRRARVHETWCAILDRHRCSVTLTAGVRDYDDLVDEVAAAVRDWQPPIGPVG